MAIPYLKGYSVKPSVIEPTGRVYYTDGTNNFSPNQEQCEAYGYTYDSSTGTCIAFNYTPLVQRTLNNENNQAQGSNLTMETGSKNSIINGNNHTVRRQAQNNILSGMGNEVAATINDSLIVGTRASGIVTNSLVLGGNQGSDALGERQNMTFMYGVTTTDNSTVDALVNNTKDSYFVPELDTAYYFQSETLALRTGGTAGGSVGDFKAWVERGVVLNSAGTLSIDRSRTSPADSGTTTGWSPINAVSGSNFRQTVKGATNMDIEWVSTIRLTQVRFNIPS